MPHLPSAFTFTLRKKSLTTFYRSSYDVIVIGAGPAGATAGYELAQKGLDVLILEKKKLPRDKTCAGLVSAKAAELLDFDIGPVVEQVTNNVELSFQLNERFKKHSPMPVGSTVRRDRFDYLLAMKAKEAGASIIDGEEVKKLEALPNGVEVLTTNHTFTGLIVIGADGACGITARSAGLMKKVETRVTIEAKVSVSQERKSENRDSTIQMDFGVVTGGYGWVFPKRGCLSVGAVAHPQFTKELKPYLKKLLSSLGLKSSSVERFRSYPLPMRNPEDPIQKERILLLGDSAGLTDPLSGEGICYAIKSAQLAGLVVEKCVKEGRINLQPYQDLVDSQIMPVFDDSRAFLSFYSYFPRSYFDLLKGRQNG